GAAFLLPPFDGADLGAIELEADSVACDRVVGDDLGAELLQGLLQAGLLLFGEVLEALFEPFEFGLVEAGSGSDVLRRYAAESAGCAGQRPVDRSEERRVGKEWREGRGAEREGKKKIRDEQNHGATQ